MTEAELKSIEGGRGRPDGKTLLFLCAEVRRLRGLIKRAEPLGLSEQDLRSRHLVNCPWCRYDISFKKKHAPECDAFTEGGDVR